MKISSKAKIGLGLVVVFAAGAICGSVGTMRYLERSFAKSINYRFWSATVMKDLDAKLHLSPEQRQKAVSILDDTEGEVNRAFRELGLVLVRLNARLNEIMSPEQRRKHTEMMQAARLELKQKFNINLPTASGVTNASRIELPHSVGDDLASPKP